MFSFQEELNQTASSEIDIDQFEINNNDVVISFDLYTTMETYVPSKNQSNWGPKRDPLYIVIPITVVYAIIFFTGVIGNISTCIVIAKNKSMHTATNYYLFSLAISDLLLLIAGLPPEMYYIWSKFPYVFGEAFCIIQGFAAETSANATVLTITAFTMERYIAICHPFLSHTMSKLSRAVKFVIAIWIVALCLAIPQAMAFGIVYEITPNGHVLEDHSICNIKRTVVPHAFEISTFVFFVAPMSLITILYILIGVQLRKSALIYSRSNMNNSSVRLKHHFFKISNVTNRVEVQINDKIASDGANVENGENYQLSAKLDKNNQSTNSDNEGRKNYTKNVHTLATKHVVKMLVAVVVAFFICWAPFHAQRLLVIFSSGKHLHPAMVTLLKVLTYVSGIFYYLSTTINPLLYHIMSHKFRDAFKDTFSCYPGRSQRPREGRLYYTLSGRSSQVNSHSGNSNVSFSSLQNNGRYKQNTDIALRRPLVVSFRRHKPLYIHEQTCPSNIDTEIKKALNGLENNLDAKCKKNKETTTKRNGKRMSDTFDNSTKISFASLESDNIDFVHNSMGEDSIESPDQFCVDVHTNLFNDETFKNDQSKLYPSKIEDIEIFHEQKMKVCSLKRHNAPV